MSLKFDFDIFPAPIMQYEILVKTIFDASIWNSLNVVRVVVLDPSAHATFHVEGGIVGVCISDL